jgi:hypothetical protein
LLPPLLEDAPPVGLLPPLLEDAPPVGLLPLVEDAPPPAVVPPELDEFTVPPVDKLPPDPLAPPVATPPVVPPPPDVPMKVRDVSTPGEVCWHELMSETPELSLAFYGELFGASLTASRVHCAAPLIFMLRRRGTGALRLLP